MWMMVEPCVLMGLFVTFSMLLPLAFPCRPTQCYMRPGDDVPICPEGTPDHLQYAPSLCWRFMIAFQC